MPLSWTEAISLLPDVVTAEGPIVAAINTYEAIPAADRKPSDLIALVATILTTVAPVADKIAADAKS